MCLDRVEESYDRPSTLIVDGWKDFTGPEKKPAFPTFSVGGKREVPLDRWIAATTEHASTGKVSAADGTRYTPGFHVYIDDKSWGAFRRVFLRKILCVGLQSGNKVAVAQEMYVSSSPNGWPPKGK